MELRRLVVAADDRTGALETAGAVADSGLTATMVPWLAGHDGGNHQRIGAASWSGPADVLVVDLGSRHLEATQAAARAGAALSIRSERSAHKIDSTLRGNWAAELGALVVAGRRVLLVPAFPAAGRTCVGGVVLEHGVAVAERHAATDIRSPVRSSRPTDHLGDAGVHGVIAVRDVDEATRWLAAESVPGVAVSDATTDDDLRVLGNAWVRANAAIVLAGTAATIGAGAAAMVADERRTPTRPAVGLPALVVVGSANPIVRAQTDSLIAAGAFVQVVGRNPPPRLRSTHSIVVLVAPELTGSVTHADATTMAAALAEYVRAWLASTEFETLVIVGGDSAAAVLGGALMHVGGTLAPGMPWCRTLVDGQPAGPLIVTKPGGFGDADALRSLLGVR